MWSTIGKIFGVDKAVDKGMDMLDKAFYTEQEEAVDKQKAFMQKIQAKVALMNAYAPFKIAQRFLAILFGFTFVGTYILVLVMYFMDKEISEVMSILEMFSISQIMTIIVLFYFGGGAVEGALDKYKQKDK